MISESNRHSCKWTTRKRRVMPYWIHDSTADTFRVRMFWAFLVHCLWLAILWDQEEVSNFVYIGWSIARDICLWLRVEVRDGCGTTSIKHRYSLDSLNGTDHKYINICHALCCPMTSGPIKRFEPKGVSERQFRYEDKERLSDKPSSIS